jgi:predicted nucleic acid-binding Zn ribbon protein
VARAPGCVARPAATAASPPGCCTRRAAGGSDRAPTCKAQAGELCKTPTGRRAGQPHTARFHPGRRELFAEQGVWEELGRWEAAVALVRFSGDGGNQGSIAAVTLEDANKRELARWGSGEGELPEALAAPIWGRYALFRGHPRISGLLMWDAPAGQVVVAGERAGQKFEELLSAPRHPYRSPISSVAANARDTSRASAPPAGRDTPAGAPEASRSCERCGEPLPAGLRAEARYCSKRCRQAASRARVKDRPPSPPPGPVEACMWCGGPIPAGLRVEARFCSKRCRQASSRHALRVRRNSRKTPAPRDTSHTRDAKALG